MVLGRDYGEMYEMKNYKQIYIILFISGTCFYIFLTAGKSIWADEAYTFAMIEHSFSEIWSITAADVHPPLYYFLLKIFSNIFGYSFLATRTFSIIPHMLIAACGGRKSKNILMKEQRYYLWQCF